MPSRKALLLKGFEKHGGAKVFESEQQVVRCHTKNAAKFSQDLELSKNYVCYLSPGNSASINGTEQYFSAR